MERIDKSRLTDEIEYLPPVPEEAYDDGYEGPTCHICDGLGHGYLIGWRLDTDGNQAQPVYSGPCTAFEDRYYPDDDERF